MMLYIYFRIKYRCMRSKIISLNLSFFCIFGELEIVLYYYFLYNESNFLLIHTYYFEIHPVKYFVLNDNLLNT